MEGKATLEWTLESGEELTTDFELQQSEDGSFNDSTVRYQGPDVATFISGLPAGDFHYRVRAISQDGVTGPWSNTITVRVEYVSFNLVLILLVAGAIVFVATVLTVGLGHRRTARETTP